MTKMTIELSVAFEPEALAVAANKLLDVRDALLAGKLPKVKTTVVDKAENGDSTVLVEIEKPAAIPSPTSVATVPKPATIAPVPSPTAAVPGPVTTETASDARVTVPVLDLDADGLPWDARIHSSGKGKKVKDQKWKRKRSISDELVQQVEAELRANVAPASMTDAATTAAATAAFAPPAATGHGITEFGQLMSRIMSTEGLDEATVLKATNAVGIDSIQLLATHPDKVVEVADELFGNG